MAWSYDPTDLDTSTASGRLELKTCNECEEVKPLSEFNKNGDYIRSNCKVCKRNKDKSRRLKSPDVVRKAQKNYYENNKELFFSNNASRRAKNKLATPEWLTGPQKAHIKRTYKIAKMMSEFTGLDYHVDHIVPLNNLDVCGLHVPWNLQVLPAKLNLSKSNSFGGE